MRKAVAESGFGDDPRFRWRGGEVTRLEAFCDIVFAFAVTLILVSEEVPTSFPELINTLTGFAAFGLTFLFVFFLWYQHYLYFRRYGLDDFWVVILNGILMFLVLFFVYPLKFLVILVVNGVLLRGFLGLDIELGISLEGIDYRALHSAYSLGFAAIACCFALLYRYALGQAGRLDLNAMERGITKSGYWTFGVVIVIALISLALVFVVPMPYAPHVAGWIYFLIWPATWLAEKRITAAACEAGDGGNDDAGRASA